MISILISMRRCLGVIAVVVVLAPFLVDVARADYGLAAGTPAVNVAGQPVLVRATPGWDAAVSYELAADAAVTVWDVAQPAADGSLWYPIGGGFVPAESLAATAAPVLAEQPVQDLSAAQSVDPATAEATTTEWVEAAPAETWADPALPVGGSAPDPAMSAWISTTGTGELAANLGAGDAVVVAPEWIDPSLASAAVGPVSGEWVDPTLSPAPVAMAGDVWVDPAVAAIPVGNASSEWIDPATAVAAEPASTDLVDPALGNVDTSDWVEPAPEIAADAALVEAATPVEVAQEVLAAPDANFVELEQQGRNDDKDKNKNRNNDNNNDKDRDKNRGGDGNEGGGGGRASTGSEIADFALQFEGYPYVYAGEGPNSFDCSGFTLFVIRKTLGMDITHDMFTQFEMGQEVGQGELQPGDLVFFKNTFRRGLSHNGIYIGGGEFIHAENESTGVVVSALNSDYYGSRWYGAVRLG